MIADRIKEILPSDLPVVIGDLPASNKEIIGIVEFDGSPNTEYFGPRQGSTVTTPVIRVIARTSSYAKGVEWTETIKNALHRYHDKTLLSVLMVGSPMYIGRTKEKLQEFQLTFKIDVKE